MAHRTVHRLACLVTLLAVTSLAKKDQSRWSRQISTYTSDISDWVPLSGPVEREPEQPQQPQIKRQAVAEPRILTEPFPGLTRPTGFSQDAFPHRNFYNAPANRQLYLQSVPSAPQNYLTDQGFGTGIRFGLSQPNFPLSQGFVAPPFGFETVQPQKPRPQPILNPVSFNQALPGPSQAKPFLGQHQKPKLEVPRLVDGYRAENVSNAFGFVNKKPQSLQKIKFDTIDKPLKPESMSQNKHEREEVQLLYVPLESLNRGQFNFRTPLTTSQLVNSELYSQGGARPNPVKQTFVNDYQRPGVKPVDQLLGQNYFSEFSQMKDVDQVPKFSTIPTPFPTQPSTTPKPKKLKPHQPPLAIFMTKEVSKNSQVKVGDVLSSLKNADTIAVLDSVNPLNAPKVFIGPSTLPPPDNFVKFELPYLSNIENSDKKLKQLPFFVAPLSYNTPNGFAKIPFPSPHVGSVVINSQIRDSSQPQAPSQPGYNQNYYAVTQPPYKPEKPVTQKPTFSYYTTAAPKPNPVPNYQSNYYSFEPQTVSSIRPPKQPETATAPPKSGSYFINNAGHQPNSQEYSNFPAQNNFKSSETDQYYQRKPDHTTTLRTTTTTTTTTTKPPSTYPSQLLETHNPYSINQAFHFSTPLDYHNYFDDIKQPYPTPASEGHSSPSPTQPATPSPTPASPTSAEKQPEQVITQKPKYRQQATPSYLQNYTPEIHHDSDPNLKYPVFNPTDYFAKTEHTTEKTQPSPVYTNNVTPAPVRNTYNQDAGKQNNYNQQEILKTNYNQEVNAPVKQTYQQDFNAPVRQTYNQDFHAPQTNNYNQDVNVPVSNNYNQDSNTPVRNNYNQEVTTPVRNNYNQEVTSPVGNNYNVENTAPVSNNYNTEIDAQVNTYKTEFNQNAEPQPAVDQNIPSGPSVDINSVPTISEVDTPPKYSGEEYTYQNNYESAEVSPTSSSTTTTTTTTRRTPQRNRGRPRYTTTPRSESYESTSKVVVTRRPLRERRPLPSRPRYEPNKITTEKTIKKLSESAESTTKSSRQRTRGRIHYKPSENEDIYDRRVKTHNSKEEDLAYQRDVLHQNYPVTLMERMSTVDIEAITEPSPKETSEKSEEPITENDTENAYTNEKASISQHYTNVDSKEEASLPTFTARSTVQTETSYVPNLPSTRQEYFYQSRSSIAPVEASAFDETSPEKEEDIYVKQTTPITKPEYDISSYATDTPASPATEQSVSFSVSHEYDSGKQEESTTAPENEDIKIDNQEHQEIEEEEENVVQTTPSYNRVRVRPGVIRQYHQASTESSRNKERKRPAQPVTYRPAFDRRRTTMRIDEIEADLKTKQVHARPEVQEIRHPVYRPEPTTEPSATSPSTTESSTKRGHFRRRRPSYSYTTTSTESSSTKRVYEVKNRFRGRRPTEKPTDKPDVQTEAPNTTNRSQLHTRYSPRPRLSERYNKKTESKEEETEDQDSNFSINRPKYAEPETDQWSPKISSDSFKPFNPNDIIDEQKVATTERRSDKESELDIITARNEFDDMLLTVTPASNTRTVKKIPEIPPTLEALVEQSKVTRSETTDSMSTFESMLEEVMKSLEEQDQDEYTTNVMKHKGGEIGEIPPERIISSGETYVQKQTTPMEEITTEQTTAYDSSVNAEDDKDRKGRRRGFWKKVKVRPASTESIEFAESQYYTHTVNRLGQPLKLSKNVHDKTERIEKPKVTTYKPSYDFIKDLFSSNDEAENIDVIPTVDIPKLTSKDSEKDETLITEESKQTTVYLPKETQTETAISPGDLDLGTGSPDPTMDDMYVTTPTEPTTTNKPVTDNKSDAGFSFMDYLFGTTSEDNNKQVSPESEAKTTELEIQITTEQPKPKIVTTESAFIPEEITAASVTDENTESVTDFTDIKKLNTSEESQTEKVDEVTETSVVRVESSSVSSFMNPANVVSTSMSTEVSHETEICFRGKCIKTSKDIL
ncbi:uncharacterized protein LOC124642408 [Helicoverpa zea]|uniref:uncharacterized protein LOC124642408 n=1 Tax=Helicoverpa zea TaxID=7113 RepID=UPI001F583411|nr:uncharacterized protein LOC124642408 [Helicoverpa zea]